MASRQRKKFDNVVYIDERDYRPAWTRPDLSRHWKTITAAVVLFTTGTILLVCGLNVIRNGDRERAISMIVIGSICFLPGSYASWILWGAYSKWPGYSFSQVPSYDE